LRHRTEVVEADRADHRHAILGTDLHLGVDSAYRPRDERDDDSYAALAALRRGHDGAASFLLPVQAGRLLRGLPRLLANRFPGVRQGPTIRDGVGAVCRNPSLILVARTRPARQGGLNLRIAELVHESMEQLAPRHHHIVRRPVSPADGTDVGIFTL